MTFYTQYHRQICHPPSTKSRSLLENRFLFSRRSRRTQWCWRRCAMTTTPSRLIKKRRPLCSISLWLNVRWNSFTMLLGRFATAFREIFVVRLNSGNWIGSWETSQEVPWRWAHAPDFQPARWEHVFNEAWESFCQFGYFRAFCGGLDTVFFNKRPSKVIISNIFDASVAWRNIPG